MIRYKNFGIEADSHCYTVGRITNRKEKDGTIKEVLGDCKYFSTLSAAICGLRDAVRRSGLAEYDGGLEDAVRLVWTLDEDLSRALNSVDI